MHAKPIGRLALLLICLLLLSACSRLDFAYSQADWYVARWAADYLSLERDQRKRIRDELDTYREFHREVRVPRIRGALQAIIADLEAGRIERGNLAGHMSEVYGQLEATTRDLLPLISEVLADLDDEQRAALAAEFEERRAEAREAIREEVASDETDDSSQPLIERAESWLGELRPEQEVQLAGCVEGMPDTRVQQLAWEIDRQDALLDRLEAGASAEGIRDFLTGWWLEARDQPAGLRESRERRRELTLDCLADFLPTLSQDQQTRLMDRLASYEDGLDDILAD